MELSVLDRPNENVPTGATSGLSISTIMVLFFSSAGGIIQTVEISTSLTFLVLFCSSRSCSSDLHGERQT
jgi:hypothetical protein